jgi:predicted MPP superfamily phosphohydrolase
MKHIAHALEVALSLKPDFLVITGDFIDQTPEDLPAFCDQITPIARHTEILGCTGNHDYHHRSIAEVRRQLTQAGIRLLENQSYQPRAGAGELSFTGFEDYWYRFDARAIDTAPPDASTIVLSHNPDSYDDIAHGRWHLMLSGHTHGGQVCIPGIGALILPVKHKNRVSGAFHLDPLLPDRMLYVSRGIGHLLRIRLFCPPEVTCFTLQPS